jgi:hypothetical protein
VTDRRPNEPRAAARGSQRDDSGRHAGHADLMGALGLVVRAGGVVPCLGRRYVWASEDAATAAAAAAACLGCPALDACGAYVAAYPEPAGVWAGLTFKQRNQRKKDNDMGSTQNQRDVLGLIHGYAVDPAGAIGMLSGMDRDEVLELTVYLLGMMTAARTVRTDLGLADWAALMLRHLEEERDPAGTEESE